MSTHPGYNGGHGYSYRLLDGHWPLKFPLRIIDLLFLWLAPEWNCVWSTLSSCTDLALSSRKRHLHLWQRSLLQVVCKGQCCLCHYLHDITVMVDWVLKTYFLPSIISLVPVNTCSLPLSLSLSLSLSAPLSSNFNGCRYPPPLWHTLTKRKNTILPAN